MFIPSTSANTDTKRTIQATTRLAPQRPSGPTAVGSWTKTTPTTIDVTIRLASPGLANGGTFPSLRWLGRKGNRAPGAAAVVSGEDRVRARDAACADLGESPTLGY